MTGGAASSSLPGPIGVSVAMPGHPSRTETWRGAVATAGWLARHSVDCLRDHTEPLSPNASARAMIPLARGPSGLAGRRRWRRW